MLSVASIAFDIWIAISATILGWALGHADAARRRRERARQVPERVRDAHATRVPARPGQRRAPGTDTGQDWQPASTNEGERSYDA